MTVIKIAVLAIVGVIILSLLKKNGSSYTVVIQLALVTLTLLLVIPEIKNLTSSVGGVQGSGTLNTESMKVMLKIFGILTVGSITADVCRDNGENALANTVELSVKILAIICAIPVFTAVVNVATSFINR